MRAEETNEGNSSIPVVQTMLVATALHGILGAIPFLTAGFFTDYKYHPPAVMVSASFTVSGLTSRLGGAPTTKAALRSSLGSRYCI